jgi:hypothetical protein
MKRNAAAWGLAIGAVVMATARVADVHWSLRAGAVEAPREQSAPQARHSPANDPADRIEKLIGRDLFRVGRSTEISEGDDGSVAVAEQAPIRPTLTLRGIVGGPPWSVLVDGVPGHIGAVILSARDTLPGLRLRSVRSDTVVITGMDTSWNLTLAGAPQP